MMKIKASPQNKKVEKQIKDSPKNAKDGIRRAFFKIGKELVRDAQLSIYDLNKTGHVYHVQLKGEYIYHRASAPGEAPANLTGNLAKSIGYTNRGWQQLEFGARAGYAPGLEIGTARVAARPFLAKAIAENNRNFKNYMINEMERAIKK